MFVVLSTIKEIVVVRLNYYFCGKLRETENLTCKLDFFTRISMI